MWFAGQQGGPAGQQPERAPGGGGSASQHSSAESSSSSGKQSNNCEQPNGRRLSFHLKTSIFTHRVSMEPDKMALGLIKQLALAFVTELYFQQAQPAAQHLAGPSLMADYLRRHFGSAESRAQLFERLVLRKYNPLDESFLPFNLVSDIEPDSYISIELSERPSQAANLLHSGSSWSVAGAPEQPANQAQSGPSSSQASLQAQPHQPHQPHQPPGAGQAGQQQQQQQQQQVRLAHDYKPESFLFITYCAICTALIKGVFKQGFQCVHCRRNFCPKCKSKCEASGEICLLSWSPAGQPLLPAPLAPTSGPINEEPKQQTEQKRKAAGNLLHFNIANPFKSHHHVQQQPSQQQCSSRPDEAAKKARSSAGGLEPILQQLSRFRAEPASGGAGAGLSALQSAHMSVSQQDLASVERPAPAGAAPGAKLAADDLMARPQLSGGASSNSSSDLRQLNDGLHGPPAKRDQNHSFVAMADQARPAGETACGACSKPVREPAGLVCRSCKLPVHLQCQGLVLTDCLSRLAECMARMAAGQRPSSPRSSAEPAGRAALSSNLSRDNIRLHRLAPSVKQVKRPDASRPAIVEGWLKHTTLSDEQSRRHYWRLDATDITLYESDTSTRYFRAIALDKIVRVLSAGELPKRVREDVLLGGQLGPKPLGSPPGSPAGLAQQQPPPLVGTRSPDSSPKRSAELEAQMRAMFAFQLTSGSLYLVQAGDEAEALAWCRALAAAARLGPQTEPGTGSDARAEPAARPADGDKSGQTVEERPTESGKPEAHSLSARQQCQPEAPENVFSNGAPKRAQHPAPPAAKQQQQPPSESPPATAAPLDQPAANQVARHYLAAGQRQEQRQQTPRSPSRPFQAGQLNNNRSRLFNRPRKTIKLDPMAIPDHWIEGRYLIERDRSKGYGFEELGSGQFGKVYAAISEWRAEDSSKGLWSGVPVAIKEISKARFDLRQQAKLKNEANILSRLDHPGVIILERVHDLPDKIYIVMEQLEDDMLEMIVSTPDKRLSERVTKFLTYQILEALKYLHAQNIAHCDLKPENVLLVERRSQFPQIKLCDFGFAKIIEDNSFRSSLVGTPAYLAPEVVRGERYNRSVDLWSVGVIVYVSLSGEFPFNEGENIHDQISRANFMYPDQPWAKISGQAKSFINSLLRVNCERRLSASRAQMDDWIQDYQLWCDLSELEVRVGKRWVTDDADYERWSRYAREHKLPIPRSAIQLHEELLAD